MKSTSLFVACVVAASLLSSCKQDPQSVTGPNLPLNTSTSAANPAVTYIGNVTARHHGVLYTYNTIGVMDSTDAHQTNVLTSTDDYTVENLSGPNWNYSGTSIGYRDVTVGGYPNAIKAVDVSVNSSGVPVGSNVRTIYAPSQSDSLLVQGGPAWCSTSSTAQIAFTRQHGSSAATGTSDLCTISQSGGSATVLYTISYRVITDSFYHFARLHDPTWSPDDSKIAVIRDDTDYRGNSRFGWHRTIIIVNASTGAITDSIPVTMGITGLEWSRSGSNELLFLGETTGGSTRTLYYCAPSTGSTPTTNSVAAIWPTWSPNNSGVMYINSSSALAKLQAFTSSSTTLQTGNPGSGLNWKR